MIPDGSFPLVTDVVANDVLGTVPDNFHISRERTQYRHRRYRITWRAISKSDLGQLLAEYQAARGGAGTTQLGHPTEGVRTVRFVDDSLRVTRRGPEYSAAQVVVEEEGPTL